FLWPALELGARFGSLIVARRVNESGRLVAAREELKQMAGESELEGSLTATERVMIHNVVDFGAVKVRDVMVPLNNVVAVKPDTTVAEALRLSSAWGVDRLPMISLDENRLG